MKLLLVTLLGLFAASEQACINDDCYEQMEGGTTETIDCQQRACNVLELDGANNILQQQG